VKHNSTTPQHTAHRTPHTADTHLTTHKVGGVYGGKLCTQPRGPVGVNTVCLLGRAQSLWVRKSLVDGTCLAPLCDDHEVAMRWG